MADENKEKPAITDYLKTKAAEVTKPDDTLVPTPDEMDSADIEFDLSTIEDEDTKAALKAVLDRAKATQKHARTLATHDMQQSIRLRALELAQELEVPEQVKDIETLLRGATTPKELDLRAREVRLDLLNESVPGKKADKPEPQDDPEKGKGKDRVFDDGRGRGVNPSAELVKKIDAVKPDDPEALTKLDEVYADVMKAQERYSKRHQ